MNHERTVYGKSFLARRPLQEHRHEICRDGKKIRGRCKKDAGAVGFAVYLDELNKGQQIPSKYDVDAVLLYDENESLISVLKAAGMLQKEGLSVRTETAVPDCLRYKVKYILRDGKPVKEEESC